ncbi:MAG: hypothetical protein AMJ79_09710 [Phycisphaerae bacterium SM23_30]|nr:MAG: hypothetical protein AMJ79_09710 [Phycisphaerae bacterium SM23_30]
MKNVKVSDETYEKLKNFVVDPFDDSPEVVIGRVVDIAQKAKTRWSPLDDYAQKEPPKGRSREEVSEAVKVL